MGGDIYFSCDSDKKKKKKKKLKGKTCITAVTVMELVSDISTTFGQKRMSPGSHLTKFCNWQIFFFCRISQRPISLSSNSFPFSNWVLQNNLWVRLLLVWTKSTKIFQNALFSGVKRIDTLPMLSTWFGAVHSKVYSSAISAWLWYKTEVRGSGSEGHLQINTINYSGTLF